jgi:hypothetical protein
LFDPTEIGIVEEQTQNVKELFRNFPRVLLVKMRCS